MSEDNQNIDKKNEVNESVTEYKDAKKQGIDENFDFEKEFKNGLTSEEFLTEMKKRISKYPWKK